MRFVWETPEEINMALAQRLSRIRKRRNLSQQALAAKSNVSFGSIKRFETTGQISLISLTCASRWTAWMRSRICLPMWSMAALRRFSVKERKLDVYFGERLVGTMAQTADRRVAFAYADEWLDSGFGISPFSLPVEQKVFVPSGQAFSGLWGVFADSLLDAWGRLLVDCMLKEKGISSADVTQLERLAIVGESGMGAMTYSPAWDTKKEETELSDLDALSAKCHAILNHEDVSNLDELFRMGGSSGGASPKIMTDDWVIKFPASGDMKDSGVMESGG